MKFYTTSSLPENCDTVIRFLNREAPVSFASKELQGTWDSVFSNDPLTLKHKEIRSLRLPVNSGFVTVLLVGFDNSVSHPFDDFRKLSAKLGEQIKALNTSVLYVDSISQLTFAPEDKLLTQFASILPLSEYDFDAHRSQKNTFADTSVYIYTSNDSQTVDSQTAQAALEEGFTIARSVMTARDLVNETADILTPEELASRTLALGKEYGFEVEVLEQEACQKLGMGLFLAVSQGSALPPRFLILRWKGGKPEEKPIAFVGKGITYDSGGLAIKTSSMELMNYDMNGAASVIGAMCAIAARRIPCNVTAVIAACENAVDSRSYRNGDIYTSMSGQTVYVRNTDAEGRLTMADAITYCTRYENPKEIIEIAGLTGSVCNFYGKVCAAALTTTQPIFDRLFGLQDLTGEKYAQMPAYEEYRELLKSPVADLNNAPAGEPGGILAALFLDQFHDDIPFLSIDSGALPFTRSASDCQPAGATGFGVRSLYYYVKESV